MSWNTRRIQNISRQIKELQLDDVNGNLIDTITTQKLNQTVSDVNNVKSSIMDLTSLSNSVLGNITMVNNDVSDFKQSLTTTNNNINNINSSIHDIKVSLTSHVVDYRNTINTITENDIKIDNQIATLESGLTTVNNNMDTMNTSILSIDDGVKFVSNALFTALTTLNTSISEINNNKYVLIDNPIITNDINIHDRMIIKDSANDSIIISDPAIASQSGFRNVVLGSLSQHVMSTGSQNVSIGYGSIRQNNGTQNTAIGDESMKNLITGSQNTCIGASSNVNATSTNSTAIGYGATSTASNEIVLGNSSVLNVKTSGKIYTSGVVVNNSTNANEIVLANGLTNTTIKTDVSTLKTDVSTLKTDVNTLKTTASAGGLPKTGGTMSGDIDMDYNRILNGSIIYTGQIFANSFITKTGSQNQFVKGDGSLDNTTYLTTSQAVGQYVSLNGSSTITGNLNLSTLITDDKNISVGGMIVGYTDTASIYMGYNAGGGSARHPSITGTSNICFGQNVGSQLTSGSRNIGIGDGTLYNITTQTSNTSVGDFAGISSVGDNNTYLGAGSGGSSGSDNVAIGHISDCSTFSNCVAIGKSATNTASNQIVLGNTNITECVLGGVGNTTSLYKGGGFLKNGGLATQQLRANGTTKISNVCWAPNGTLGSSTSTATMSTVVYFIVQECPYSMTTSSIVLYRPGTSNSNFGCGIYNSSNVRLASALSGSTTSTTYTIPIVCDLIGGQYYYICFSCPGGVIYGNSSTGVAITNNDLITGYTAKCFSISGTSVPLTITGTATLTSVVIPYFKVNGTL